MSDTYREPTVPADVLNELANLQDDMSTLERSHNKLTQDFSAFRKVAIIFFVMFMLMMASLVARRFAFDELSQDVEVLQIGQDRQDGHLRALNSCAELALGEPTVQEELSYARHIEELSYVKHLEGLLGECRRSCADECRRE